MLSSHFFARWREIFVRFDNFALRMSRWFFQETFFRTNCNFPQLFWTLGEESMASSQNYFGSVVKTAFYLPRATCGEKQTQWIKLIFLTFWTSSKIFQLWQKLSSTIDNLACYMIRKLIWGNFFSLNSFANVFAIWEKNCGILAKIFQQGSQNCIPLEHRNAWR